MSIEYRLPGSVSAFTVLVSEADPSLIYQAPSDREGARISIKPDAEIYIGDRLVNAGDFGWQVPPVTGTWATLQPGESVYGITLSGSTPCKVLAFLGAGIVNPVAELVYTGLSWDIQNEDSKMNFPLLKFIDALTRPA